MSIDNNKQYDQKFHGRAKLSLFLTIFIDLVGFGIIIPLLPFLSRKFSATPFEIGLLMAIYSLMQLIFSPVWGALSDRWGRRPIILMSLVGSFVSYLLFAFSTNLMLLFISRALSGIMGGTISTANAYIADITPPKDRSKEMGLVGAAFGLGFIFGPLLGAGFADMGERLGALPPFGQSFAAVGATFLCFINFILAWKSLPESLPPERRSKSVSIEKNIKSSSLSVLKDLFLFRIPWINRLVAALIGAFFLNSLAMALMEVMLFPYVQEKFQWNVKMAGLGFAYVGIVMAFTQGYLIRKIAGKVTDQFLLTVGLIASALSLGLIPLCPDPYWLALDMTLLGVGSGFIRPANLGLISIHTSDTEQGKILGVTQGLASLGRVVGPPWGGYLYQTYGSASPFFAAGAIGALALFSLILFTRKRI